MAPVNFGRVGMDFYAHAVIESAWVQKRAHPTKLAHRISSYDGALPTKYFTSYGSDNGMASRTRIHMPSPGLMVVNSL